MQASILLKYEDEVLSNELMLFEMSALKKKKQRLKGTRLSVIWSFERTVKD